MAGLPAVSLAGYGSIKDKRKICDLVICDLVIYDLFQSKIYIMVRLKKQLSVVSDQWSAAFQFHLPAIFLAGLSSIRQTHLTPNS